MIDFILGLLIGAGAMWAFNHQTPAKQALELSFFSTLERKVRAMIQDALNDLKTAWEADKAKAVAEAVANAAEPAKAEQAAADEQAVRDFQAANFPPEQPAA